MQRLKIPAVCVVLSLPLVGCGGDTSGPETASHVPGVGTYTYEFAYRLPGDPSDRVMSGELVLTYATADSIAGHWNVANYEPEPDLGFYNVDAYVLYANPTWRGGTFVHRISRSGGEYQLSCSGHYLRGDLSTHQGRCSLDWTGE